MLAVNLTENLAMIMRDTFILREELILTAQTIFMLQGGTLIIYKITLFIFLKF
jgi:hypothetical protein